MYINQRHYWDKRSYKESLKKRKKKKKQHHHNIVMADKAYSHIYISNAEDNSYHLLLYDSNLLQIPSFHGALAPPTPPCKADNSSTFRCIVAVPIPAPSSFANSQRLPELKHTHKNCKCISFLWLHCVFELKNRKTKRKIG